MQRLLGYLLRRVQIPVIQARLVVLQQNRPTHPVQVAQRNSEDSHPQITRLLVKPPNRLDLGRCAPLSVLQCLRQPEVRGGNPVLRDLPHDVHLGVKRDRGGLVHYRLDPVRQNAARCHAEIAAVWHVPLSPVQRTIEQRHRIILLVHQLGQFSLEYRLQLNHTSARIKSRVFDLVVENDKWRFAVIVRNLHRRTKIDVRGCR